MILDAERQAQANTAASREKSAAPVAAGAKPGLSPALVGGVVAAGGETVGTVDRPALNLVKKGDIEKAAEPLMSERPRVSTSCPTPWPAPW
ncbi:hypothetical protein MBTS_21085 [Methylobacterium bullatum]|nr:hypothetical protein [Methylobacterium bullatum]